MSEQQAAKPVRAKDEAWRVTVRHTRLRPDHKRQVVQANSREAAWSAYLDKLDELLVEANYKTDPRGLEECRKWRREVKKDGIPEDAEINTDAYLRGRLHAIRVRGAVRREDVGGYAELASA